MTDLTEQWRKGELPEGWYYVKDEDGRIIISEYYAESIDRETNETECVWSCLGEPEQVLAEVPTFEKWQATEKYNKHLEEKIKIYERKDKQATETSIAYNELLEENTQLKELLKEWVQFEIEENPNDFTVMSERISELANKTKEVLK